MGISLEPIHGTAYVLRGGPQHESYETRDPYEGVGTVEIKGQIAEIKAFLSLGGVPLAEWYQLRRLLRPLGVRRMTIERSRGGRTTKHRWRI